MGLIIAGRVSTPCGLRILLARIKTLGDSCHNAPVHWKRESSDTRMFVGTKRLRNPTRKWDRVNVRSIVNSNSLSHLRIAFGWKSKLSLANSTGSSVNGTPLLFAHQIAHNGLEVQLVGKFQDEDPFRAQDILDLRQGLGGIGHVMQGPDHGHSIEQAIDEGKAVGVGGHVNIFLGGTESQLGLFELGARIVQQDDAVKAEVARRISPGARSQLQEDASSWGAGDAAGRWLRCGPRIRVRPGPKRRLW